MNKKLLEQEIAELQKKLEEKQKELDKLPPKWSPKDGNWIVTRDSEVVEYYFTSIEEKEFGMAYPTKEQAETASKLMRIHNRLLAYVAEFAPNYEPDWDDPDTAKCKIIFDGRIKSWKLDANYTDNVLGAVYMPRCVAEELVRKLNDGEVEF